MAPTIFPFAALIGDEVARVPGHASLVDVAAALTEREIGIVAVGDGDLPDGVVSERDIVRAVARGRDLTATTAMDVAHTELRWVEPDATVGEVATEMMQQLGAPRAGGHRRQDGRHRVGPRPDRRLRVDRRRDLSGVAAAPHPVTRSGWAYACSASGSASSTTPRSIATPACSSKSAS